MSPAAAFVHVNMDQLYLPFLRKLFDVVAACQARGADYRATIGYRDFPSQAALYFQGRTMPGKRVTNAGPGDSPHNYGLAVDFVRNTPIGLDWEAADYSVLGEEARKAGLAWGGDFKSLVDCPHVQWPGYVTSEELAPLKSVWLRWQGSDPLSHVFEFLDAERKGA